MIISLLLDALYNVFNLLTSAIDIPNFPIEAEEYFDAFISYLQAGAGIVANYTPLPYLLLLFGIILAVDIGIKIYHFVMWVLKKIPFLGMS